MSLMSSMMQAVRMDPGLMFLHLATTSTLVAFLFQDPLGLRSFSLVANGCSFYYCFTRLPRLTMHCCWSSLFFSVNSYYVTNL